jgi:hypothetical protein
MLTNIYFCFNKLHVPLTEFPFPLFWENLRPSKWKGSADRLHPSDRPIEDSLEIIFHHDKASCHHAITKQKYAKNVLPARAERCHAPPPNSLDPAQLRVWSTIVFAFAFIKGRS